MASNTVIEKRQLQGSPDDNLLQRVATVYVDGEEYRVLAPPKAIGDALDWIEHFSVRQPNRESFNSEIAVQGAYRLLALKLVKAELEKTKESSSSAYRQENRKAKLRELLNDLKHFRSCGPSDD